MRGLGASRIPIAAGGVYGDSYDLKVGEGTASAFAINSGRMAVRKILADK